MASRWPSCARRPISPPASATRTSGSFPPTGRLRPARSRGTKRPTTRPASRRTAGRSRSSRRVPAFHRCILLDLGGGEPRKLTDLAAGVQDPLVFSPDGKKLAFVSDVYPDCADEVQQIH